MWSWKTFATLNSAAPTLVAHSSRARITLCTVIPVICPVILFAQVTLPPSLIHLECCPSDAPGTAFVLPQSRSLRLLENAIEKSAYLFRSCSPYGTSAKVGASGLLFEFGRYVFGPVPVFASPESSAQTAAVRDSKLTTQQDELSVQFHLARRPDSAVNRRSLALRFTCCP